MTSWSHATAYQAFSGCGKILAVTRPLGIRSVTAHATSSTASGTGGVQPAPQRVDEVAQDRLADPGRRQPGAGVEGPGVDVQLGRHPGRQQPLGVGDALVAKRVELVRRHERRRQPGEVGGARRRGVRRDPVGPAHACPEVAVPADLAVGDRGDRRRRRPGCASTRSRAGRRARGCRGTAGTAAGRHGRGRAVRRPRPGHRRRSRRRPRCGRGRRRARPRARPPTPARRSSPPAGPGTGAPGPAGSRRTPRPRRPRRRSGGSRRRTGRGCRPRSRRRGSRPARAAASAWSAGR